MDLLKQFEDSFKRETVELTFNEYLEECKKDSFAYASPAERLLQVIGEPKILDTKTDPVLSRIFSNRRVKLYEKFNDFYGIEEVIENIVSFLRFNSQNLEESKSILYLLGPVGSSKSSLVERLKELMEKEPLYVIKDSPVFDNPLNVFWGSDHIKVLEKQYHIPAYAVRTCPSPWLVKRLREDDGKISKLKVLKVYPSRLEQRCIAKVEPGDENNTDISNLVGKVDIRKLEEYSQNDPDAYSYSGGLCRANRGLMDFVECFKAPIKMLNPLLTATQERNYNSVESIGSLPFEGVIVCHSNEQEWQQFKSNRANEAIIDRITLVKVPYCLRSKEEKKIYEKLLKHSTLSDAPCAPWTLDFLAKFCVLSRLKETKNSTLYSKLRVYDGENIKDVDPKAKPIQEYRDEAGVTEGMTGISTRFAFKVLSKTFNHDTTSIGANPVHLMLLLKREIAKEQFSKENEERLNSYIDSTLSEKYQEVVEKDIRKALLSAHQDYCQTVFEKYILWADHWLNDNDFRDETGLILDKNALNSECETLEKAGLEIANPREFRMEAVTFVLRYRADNAGKAPRWDAYAKIRDVIERMVLNTTESFLPIISFSPKASDDDKKKHHEFVAAMNKLGYDDKAARIVSEWYLRVRKTS